MHILQKVNGKQGRKRLPLCLVLSPTRELAQQVRCPSSFCFYPRSFWLSCILISWEEPARIWYKCLNKPTKFPRHAYDIEPLVRNFACYSSFPQIQLFREPDMIYLSLLSVTDGRQLKVKLLDQVFDTCQRSLSSSYLGLISIISGGLQIADVLSDAGRPCGLTTVCVYGGTSKEKQISSLKSGVVSVRSTCFLILQVHGHTKIGICC